MPTTMSSPGQILVDLPFAGKLKLIFKARLFHLMSVQRRQ